jgi:hypothetical protein
MKTYKGYQFKAAVAELVIKIGKSLGCDVSIKWSCTCQTAGINQYGHIIMADVADDANLTHADLLKYCGFGVHELLHFFYTNFSYDANNQYVRELHNAVEDAWIEHKGIANTVTGNIKNLLSLLIDNMVVKALVEVKDWSDPRQYPFVLAVYLRDHAVNKIPLAQGLQDIFDVARVKLDACTDSADTLRVAQWVYDQLNALPSKKPSKGPTSPDQGEGEGEGADQPSDGPVGDASAPGDDCVPAPVEPENEAPKGKEGMGHYSESARVKRDDYHLGQSWMKDDLAVPAGLRYSVRRLFEDSGIDEFQRNRKSGAVDIHSLPSVAYNNKVFKRRNEVEGIDTAVTILLDVSSSMFGDGDYNKKYMTSNRIVVALQTCIALLDTLQRAQVSTAVLTFGGCTAVLKPFEMNAKQAMHRLRMVTEGGSTNDYFAVRYAHKLLLNRPEARKICFVITDGDGDIYQCNNQVKVGERMGITTIGLGIDHNVAHVYPQNATVRDLKELGSTSFKQIKLAA